MLVSAIAGTNYLSYLAAKNLIINQVGDTLLLVSDLQLRDFNSFVDGISNRVIDFASDGFIRNRLIDVESGAAGARDQLNKHLIENKLPLANPPISSLNVVDLNGLTVASTDPAEIGADHSGHEHFEVVSGFAYGKSYFGEVEYRGEGDEKSAFVVMTAPLFDVSQQKRIGAIEAIVDIRQFNDVINIRRSGKDLKKINRIELAKSFETLLVDSNGISLTELRFSPASFLNKVIETLPVKNCKNNIETDGTWEDYRGVEVVGSSRCLQRGWTMVVKIDASDAFSPAASIRTNITAVSLAAILVMFALIYFFVNTLIKPINKLKIIIEKFGAGDFSQRIKVTSRDEIGEFARMFNSMADSLEGSHKNLEAKVAEKTASLNEKVAELTEAQKALINVVEDLNTEKDIVNKERAKDEALLGSIGDGVIAIDRDKRIIYTNPAADVTMGWKSADVVGKLYNEVWEVVDEAGNVVPATNRPMEMAFAGKKSVSRNVYYRNVKNDKKIPVSGTVAPIILDGELVGVINVFKDITEEAKIDKAKTEFVSIASHQLRTPLTAVKWYAEMLLDKENGKLSKKQANYLNEIYAGNQRMISLVSALLNVSRIDLGTFAIEPEPTDIVKLADDVLNEMIPGITKKELEITRDYGSSIPKINVDAKLTRIVIQNLLSNAVKYTPSKGKITVSVFADKKNILIKVKDTGYGIPKDAQKKIFTKLFRADNVKIKEPEGTGLGLYIIKAIVDQSGGKIWFESTEGEGTTFYVSMPLTGMPKKIGAKELINE